jgi:DNA-binding response OmpR family regulator
MENPVVQIQMADEGTELVGLRLLIVEDDYLVAADMCSSLQRRGATILGPVPNARRGRELAQHQRPDAALLDINLNGQLAFELAHELQEAGIPTIFTTGYDAEFLPQTLRNSPCLQKPVNLNALVHLLRDNSRASH